MEETAKAKSGSLLGAYLSTLFLTITIPMTILSFIAIFAGLNMGERQAASLMVLVAGVFAGSAAWWLTLSFGVSLMRERVNAN